MKPNLTSLCAAMVTTVEQGLRERDELVWREEQLMRELKRCDQDDRIVVGALKSCQWW